jgi:hypothetical protein
MIWKRVPGCGKGRCEEAGMSMPRCCVQLCRGAKEGVEGLSSEREGMAQNQSKKGFLIGLCKD